MGKASKGRPSGKTANSSRRGDEPLSTSSGSGFGILLPVVIAAVAGLVYTMQPMQPGENDGLRRTPAPVMTEWLDAAATPETNPELNFLTAPVPQSHPLYKIYPPQKGLHVLKQMGGGLMQVFQDADGMTPPRNATVTAKTMPAFREQIEAVLPLGRAPSEKGLKQDWRVFSDKGQVLSSISEVMGERLLVIMDGGQWIWPTVKVRDKPSPPNNKPHILIS